MSQNATEMKKPGEASGSRRTWGAVPAGGPQAEGEPAESALESTEAVSAAVELGQLAEMVAENLLWNYVL